MGQLTTLVEWERWPGLGRPTSRPSSSAPLDLTGKFVLIDSPRKVTEPFDARQADDAEALLDSPTAARSRVQPSPRLHRRPRRAGAAAVAAADAEAEARATFRKRTQ